MAPLNIYDFTIPQFIRQLDALSAILTKAFTYESAEMFPSGRLAPDMQPLTFQVQMCSRMAFLLVTKLCPSAGPVPEFANDEKTIDDMQVRIAKTIEFLKTVKREGFEGQDEAQVEFLGNSMNGLQLTTERINPNFFFHVVTAYNILRNQAVEIGKVDFLGVAKK